MVQRDQCPLFSRDGESLAALRRIFPDALVEVGQSGWKQKLFLRGRFRCPRARAGSGGQIQIADISIRAKSSGLSIIT